MREKKGGDSAPSLTRVIIAKDVKCEAEFSVGTTLRLDATGTSACLAARKRKKEGEEEEEELTWQYDGSMILDLSKIESLLLAFE